MKNTQIVTQESTMILPAARLADLLQPFGDALTLRESAGEISANTRAAYLRGAEKFLTWCEQNASGLETPDAVRSWKAALLSAGYKPATINAWLAGVKALGAWAQESRKLPYNPMAGTKGATRKGTNKHHERESLTSDEARRLLAITDVTTATGKRDAAIIALMLFTGLRTVEVYRADIADLATRGGRLVLMVQGKGHAEKDDFVILTGEADDKIRSWLAARGSKPGPLFVSLSNRSTFERLSLRALRDLVGREMRAAGVVGNKTTHSLRHTAISTVARKAGVVKASKLARHASIETTMIYIHELDRMTDPAEGYITYDD